MTTLPGLLFVDWYDSAIGQFYGADAPQAVEAQMAPMWGAAASILRDRRLLLALPLATSRCGGRGGPLVGLRSPFGVYAASCSPT